MPPFSENPKIVVNENVNFRISSYKTNHSVGIESKKEGKKLLKKNASIIHELQRRLFASANHSILIIFQAMDAAGKDSTIRKVFGNSFPQGTKVVSFKVPSKIELSHDFLWRSCLQLPRRGHTAIFNRSYYEEVLVTKVHPEYILGQNIPAITHLEDVNDSFWKNRYDSIKSHEDHLANNGTTVMKFFLNIGLEEQKNRFLYRINNQEKNWKFSLGDLDEREKWADYQNAYEQAIQHTATKTNPWHIIPADNKWYMQALVSQLIVEKMKSLNLNYPKIGPKEEAELKIGLQRLKNEK